MARPQPPSTARLAREESGFSIVEVIVGMMVLVVAVLGTTSLVQGAAASTARTQAREQGTNVARDLIERSRQIDYTSLSPTDAAAALRQTLPASDATADLGGSKFTVKRRNVTYTVTVTACAVDDPADGAGVGDARFCVDEQVGAGDGGGPSATPTPSPSATPAPQLSASVLGIPVNLGGSLLQTVCNAVGNPDVLEQLTTVVSAVAPMSLCPSGGGVGGKIRFDSDPDDMRRVTFGLSWGRNGETLVQTTLLPNPN